MKNSSDYNKSFNKTGLINGYILHLLIQTKLTPKDQFLYQNLFFATVFKFIRPQPPFIVIIIIIVIFNRKNAAFEGAKNVHNFSSCCGKYLRLDGHSFEKANDWKEWKMAKENLLKHFLWNNKSIHVTRLHYATKHIIMV